MNERMLQMIDISDPKEGIEIQISKDCETLWVNVDGVCRLRVQSHTTKPLRIDLDNGGRVSTL